MTRPQRWNRVSQWLLRWVDPVRGEELRTHIDDATSEGEPLRAADTVSVLGLVVRTQARRAMDQAPLLIAGLPVALLCVVAYAVIYETHFRPWDLMEETPSTDPTAAAIRRATDLAWIVLVPLALLSGWRVARSISRGNYVLPAAYLVGLFVLISQANLFIQHTAWFADGRLRARHVDDVSPYSVGLLAISFVLPALYLALDWLSRRNDSRSTTTELTTPARDRMEHRVDRVAVAAILSPLLVVFSSIAAVALFLLLVWLAESFQLRHKLAATIALASPLAAAVLLVGQDGMDDPGLGFFGFVAFFVIVWAWLASVVRRSLVSSAADPDERGAVSLS